MKIQSPPVDINGCRILVNDQIAWAYREGNAATLRLGTVTKVTPELIGFRTDKNQLVYRQPNQVSVTVDPDDWR